MNVSRMWDDPFDYFATHFRVVCFDHRGYGRSDIPKEPFFPTEDVSGLLNHLAIFLINSRVALQSPNAV